MFNDLKEHDLLIEVDWCYCRLGAEGLVDVFIVRPSGVVKCTTSTSRSVGILFRVDWLS